MGKAIVFHMLEKAFGRYDLPEVRISVFSENTPALLLYSGFGFVPYGIEERSDKPPPKGKRVALIHMRLLLELSYLQHPKHCSLHCSCQFVGSPQL